MPAPVCELNLALGVGERELVALVGGGGKTAALKRLAREQRARGRRVLVTTTAKMYREQLSALGPLILSNSCPSLIMRLRQAFSFSQVVSAGVEIGAEDKVRGLPPDWVDEIWNTSLADLLLVEADGSRGKSLKAPAVHEPVIPNQTTLVVPVAGLDVLGKPLGLNFVHRPEVVVQIAGEQMHSPVTAGTVARVMVHPSGLIKGAPPGARVVPLINKVDQMSDLPLAQEVAVRIVMSSKRIDRVVLANCEGQPFACRVFDRNDITGSWNS